jgi:hypothetical protein
MPRKFLSLGVLGALAAASMTIAPTAASAQYYGSGGYGYHGVGNDRGWHGDRGYDRAYYGRGGYDRGGYDRGGYDRYYGHRHRCNGTGGAIIGAVAGGLLGNAVAGYGDRTAGTLIGGGLGAVAGNAIGRDC